ncbi:MAG: hypothetical protein Q8R90_11625 [Bacteroidales bacterium]|nr:hypothetical protein [Bacteroidales bacterium]
MKKFTLTILLFFSFICLFTSCLKTYYYSESIVYSQRKRYDVSLNSYGNYNLQGKTFYLESGDNKVSSYDVEFKEYADYVVKALKLEGAIETNNKENADMCILVTYGISDESYRETVPIPIWGQTGISSINTTTNTTGSSQGTITRVGNTIYGAAQGNSTTNTTTTVNPTYGITGYTSVDRKVTQFRRVLNIYAYDNIQTDKTIMLWKTNIISDGHSSDLRILIPVMAFCGSDYMGNSSGETKNYYLFEDQDDFLSWKKDMPQDPNVVSYPKFNSSNVNPNDFIITKINKTKDETIIDFIAFNTGYVLFKFKISPNTYIEFEKQQYKVISAGNIVLGENKDVPKNGSWEFRLHFPAIPSNADYINISDGMSSGWKWNGVKLK